MWLPSLSFKSQRVFAAVTGATISCCLPVPREQHCCLSWHRCGFELAVIKNVARTAPAQMEVWILLSFLLLIETPSGLYCKEGVIASPSSWCPAWSAVLYTSVWACVASRKGSVEGATLSAFREENYCSGVALVTCERLHIQTECCGGSVHVAQRETFWWICPQSRDEFYLLNHHVLFMLCLSN